MKRLVLVALVLALATPATALNINTPTVEASEACPSIMNGFVSWLRGVFGNPWVVNN